MINSTSRFVALAALAGSMAVWAQTDQARFSGTVKDASGAVIQSARITVINEKTGQERTAQANASGDYSVTNLLPAPYTVRAESEGLLKHEFKNLELQIGQVRRVDFTLQVQATSNEITVSAGGLSEVDTSSARIGVNVSEREVAQLPLNGRQLSQLYLLTPGAQTAGGGTYDNIRFNGRSNQQNAVRFDGVEGTSIIDSSPGNLNGQTSSSFRLQASLETVQEFRVESSNYPAEYGTGTGGQISVVTKSGGNAFHGAIFEYLRNDALDARNFFDSASKVPLRLNQYGLSIGGPIVRNKLFFFAAFEGLSQRAGFNLFGQVPSRTVRAYATCAAGQTSGCINAAVRPLLAAYPTGTIATANPLWDVAQLVGSAKVDEYSGSMRLDYRVSDKDQVYLRWFRDNGDSSAPFDVSNSIFNAQAQSQNALINWQRIVRPTVINELKFGYNGPKTRTNGVAPQVSGVDLSNITLNVGGPSTLSGIGGQGTSAGISVPSGLVRSSSATNGRGQPYTNYSLSFIDGLSWVKGAHSFKFGGELRLVRMYTDRLGGVTYSYSTLENFLNNVTSSVAVLGDVSQPSPFNNGVTGNRFGKASWVNGYAQDEWRVTPSLTLSLGLRYEYYQPMYEDKNRVVLFNTVTGTLDAPGSRPFFRSSKANFGPRVGISWAPSAMKNRTVLRIGSGYYYGPGQLEDQIQPIESDRVSTSLAAGTPFPVDAASIIKNFNLATATGVSVRAYAPGYSVPEKILSYTASLQQTLPGGTVLTVAYVGSQGRNLFLRSISNYITGVGTNATSGAAIITRQFGSKWAEIDYKTSGGTDHYDSLQTSVNRRFSKGFTLGGQWTYGHSLGNTAGSNEAVTAASPFDFKLDRGNNNFDVRHSANVTALYELPVGRGRTYGKSMNRVADAVAGGWEVGGVFNGRTGLPIDVLIPQRPDVVYIDTRNNTVVASPILVGGTPVTTAVINVPGGGLSRNVRRPNVVAGVNPYINVGGTQFLNPAAFSTPAPGTFGNFGRNALHGPNLTQFDLTLHKRFSLTERLQLQFNAEIYNLFNKTNFANPNSSLSTAIGTGTNQLQPNVPYTQAAAGSFGQITSTVERTVGLGASRQIQMSLRLMF